MPSIGAWPKLAAISPAMTPEATIAMSERSTEASLDHWTNSMASWLVCITASLTESWFVRMRNNWRITYRMHSANANRVHDGFVN